MPVNRQFTVSELDTIKAIQSDFAVGIINEMESVWQISAVLKIRLCKQNVFTLASILYADYR